MAQEIADSTLFDTWASSGLIVKPDIGKIIEGWQLGEQPPHEYMNWLQNTFGSKLNHILKNGVSLWNNKTQYLAGSSVQHNGNVWLCKVDNTNSEPTNDNNNWDSFFKSLMPVATIIQSASQITPTGFLKCNGAAISRAAYSELFSMIGTTFGIGDGSTTFNLPDLRGRFIRGFSDGSSIDSGRAFGSSQDDAIRNITGATQTGIMVRGFSETPSAWVGAIEQSWRDGISSLKPTQTEGTKAMHLKLDASKVVPTASENRPYNIALNFYIKY